jgi:hypothetical protein
VNAETVDSWTAVRVKGSSPLEVRKTFSMVLLEVRILLHTPSFVSVDVVKVQPRKLYERAERCPVCVSGTQVTTITTYLQPVGRFEENTGKMMGNERGPITYKFNMPLWTNW